MINLEESEGSADVETTVGATGVPPFGRVTVVTGGFVGLGLGGGVCLVGLLEVGGVLVVGLTVTFDDDR
jgi:hypothetical protein